MFQKNMVNINKVIKNINHYSKKIDSQKLSIFYGIGKITFSYTIKITFYKCVTLALISFVLPTFQKFSPKYPQVLLATFILL